MFLFFILHTSEMFSLEPDFNIIIHFDDSVESDDNSTKVENEMDITNKQLMGIGGPTNC